MKDRAGGDGCCFLGFIFGFGRTLRKICTTIKLIGKTIRLEMIPTITCINGIKQKMYNDFLIVHSASEQRFVSQCRGPERDTI